MQDVAKTGAASAETAMVIINEQQRRAVCMLPVGSAEDSQFEAMGVDDEGVYLQRPDGAHVRLGRLDRETVESLGEVMDYESLFLVLCDSEGGVIDQYDIDPVGKPQPAGYGA